MADRALVFSAVAGGGGLLDFELHAVERFIERCRPGLDFAGGAAEFRRVTEAIGVVVDVRPVWLNGEQVLPARYLMLGPDIVCPVVGRTVTTCIPRGEVSEAARTERQRRRRVRAETRARRRGRGSQAAEGNDVRGRGAAA